MDKKNLPAGAAEIGAEVRKRTSKPPLNESYLVDVTELLRVITDRELTKRRRRCGREAPL
jgi:hypothetical protein